MGIEDPPDPTRVLLVGLMASGKSTIGGAIAALLDWPVLDNDVVLERSNGASADDIYRQDGLERLRRAESDVLTVTLSMPPPLIAGVAAGVVLDAQDRARLIGGGHVVYLRTPVDVLVARVSDGDHRPLLDGDVETTLTAMYAERDPLYLEVAHQVLELPALTPAESAAQVVAALRARELRD